MDFTSRILRIGMIYVILWDFIIKVQTMSNLPTLSVFGTVSDVVDDLFGVLERNWKQAELCITSALWDIGWDKMDLGDFPPM